MARVIVSLRARADTARIIAELGGKAGHSVATKYAAAFEALFARLAEYPESGAPRPVLGAHVRIGVVSPYIVIHEHDVADDMVTILRILHGRREITRRLLRQ